MRDWKIYLIVAVLAVTSFGCAKQLTRGKAAKMIAKKYPIPVEYEFLGSWTHVDEFVEFEKKGWISGVRVVSDFIGRSVQPSYWSIKEEGRKYFRKSGSNSVIAKIGEKVFVEVTGIKMSEKGTSAQVEYKWKYRVNEIYNAVKSHSRFSRTADIYSPEKDHESIEYFALYDDGWRIE